MKQRILILFFTLCMMPVFGMVPKAYVSGTVQDEHGNPVVGAAVALRDTPYQTLTDEKGTYILENVPYGEYTIVAFYSGKKVVQRLLDVDETKKIIDFVLEELNELLKEVVVNTTRDENELVRLNAVENFGIYEGKKTEVVSFRNLMVNTAANNARQIYSKITGLNIWESDGAGLQLGIGGRGLNPDRTANFNTRQNGYDISADALGYPESYYTPPAEALDQIEIIRGAASLQYGTQFGGLLNFKFKKGPADKKIELTSRQTAGSWGFFGSFNSLGGTVAKGKLNYYSYFNYKRGDGYRQNSDFDFQNAFASVNYQINPSLLLNVEYTRMNYLAHQPGGLTDALFARNPVKSFRERNWFKVDWNLLAVNLTYKISHLTEINIRNFGLVARRQSLGNMDKINVIDFGGDRMLIDGQFRNMGNETRLLHRYKFFGRQNAMVAGFRLYRGTSNTRQGFGDDGSGPNFNLLNPEDVEFSDNDFVNNNFAFFIENIFDITPRFSITPGIRFEEIHTSMNGFYKERSYDLAGNLVGEKKTDENRMNKRNFVIMGAGLSYKATDKLEYYSNLSMNYRAINFTDLRIINPSLKTDLDLKDERGFTADAGIRGSIGDWMSFETTAFYISYKDKIGNQFEIIEGKEVRFRDNVSDARNIGVEAFTELQLTRLFNYQGESMLSFFLNSSIIDARYINSENVAVENKKVEMVPPLMIRLGLTYRYRAFSSTLQFAHTGEHFSDAYNTPRTASAVEGIIPAYQVMDVSAGYSWRKWRIEASCNNLLNEQYFTRRADSYPGPGIIPSEGRGFYLTLQARVGK